MCIGKVRRRTNCVYEFVFDMNCVFYKKYFIIFPK